MYASLTSPQCSYTINHFTLAFAFQNPPASYDLSDTYQGDTAGFQSDANFLQDPLYLPHSAHSDNQGMAPHEDQHNHRFVCHIISDIRCHYNPCRLAAAKETFYTITVPGKAHRKCQLFNNLICMLHNQPKVVVLLDLFHLLQCALPLTLPDPKRYLTQRATDCSAPWIIVPAVKCHLGVHHMPCPVWDLGVHPMPCPVWDLVHHLEQVLVRQVLRHHPSVRYRSSI